MSFLASLPPHGPARNAVISEAIADGRIDPVTWVRVPMGHVEIEVSADYLTIRGERVPMAAPVAQAAVDALDAILPTPAIVDAIEAAATIVPMPTRAPNGKAQLSAEWFAWCEGETRKRMVDIAGLVAGHRKDVVLAKAMPAGRVVIYGARWPDGRRIQPVFAGHEAAFADYSHGVRAIRRRCWIDGAETTVDAILSGPNAHLLGGPVAMLRYPAASPAPVAVGPRVLRRGMTGEDVRDLQAMLTAAGFPAASDGIFGGKTEQALVAFQKRAGLTPDGAAGPATMAALRKAPATSAAPQMPIDAARALGVQEPLSEAEIDDVFGEIPWSPVADDPGAILVPASWKSANLVTIRVPQLVGVADAHRDGLVQINKRIAEPFRAMFDAWEQRGKMKLVTNFGGTVADRRVRGGQLVSRHARGIAFDINTQPNWRGTPGAPRGSFGSIVELFEEFVEFDFASGGFYPTADWMHAEGTG